MISIVFSSCQNKEQKLMESFLEDETEYSFKKINKGLFKIIKSQKEKSLTLKEWMYSYREEVETKLDKNLTLEEVLELKTYFLNKIDKEGWKGFFNENPNFSFLKSNISENSKRLLLKDKLLSLPQYEFDYDFNFCGLTTYESALVKKSSDKNLSNKFIARNANICWEKNCTPKLKHFDRKWIETPLTRTNSFYKVNLKNISKGTYTFSGKLFLYTMDGKIEFPFEEQIQIK